MAMLLASTLTTTAFKGGALAATRLLHSAAVLRAPASADVSSSLQGLLGLGAAEVQTVLDSQPSLAREKVSVVQERMQFLKSGLGISPARLRCLIVEKPALLSDLNIRELRSLAGV